MKAFVDYIQTIQDAGIKTKEKRHLFTETFSQYLENYVKHKKSRAQYVREKRTLLLLKQYLKKDVVVFNFERSDALQFIEWVACRGEKRLSNASLNKTTSSLSFFYNRWLVDMGFNPNEKNPFQRISFKEDIRDV